jgi:hypothetical protein
MVTTARHTYYLAPAGQGFTHARGLSLNVLHGAYESTNHGVSSLPSRSLVLVGTLRTDEAEVTPLPRGSRVFDAREDAPPVALATRWVAGAPHPYVVPVTWNHDHHVYIRTGQWHMAGGNYAVGDSRLGRVC